VRISEMAALRLREHASGSSLSVRLLVNGGDGGGFHVGLHVGPENWSGDHTGEDHGIAWRVDPVSWQYLSSTVLDVSDGEVLVLRGVPGIGPGSPTQDLSISLD